MGLVDVLLLLLLAGPTLGALYALYAVVRMRRSLAVLATERPPLPEPWPTLSLISPACDEGEHVGLALRTVLGQDYPELQVVAVDDRSTDDTGALIDGLAAEDSRVTPVHIRELPEGWLGKVHALHVGTGEATGEWLLFADADVRFEPGALRRAVAWAVHRRLDLLTLFPRLESAGLLCDAAYNIVALALAAGGRPWAVPDPDSDAVAGMGAFILVRRSAWEASPGFEWLRLEVADDMALGLLIKTHGGRCAVANGAGLLRLPWYASYADMSAKMQKNWFAIVGHFSAPLLLAKAAVVLGIALAPLGVLLPWTTDWLRLAALPGPLLLAAATWLAARWARLPLRLAWLPQVGLLAYALMMARSAWVGWRVGGVQWRGQLYRSEDLAPRQRIRL